MVSQFYISTFTFILQEDINNDKRIADLSERFKHQTSLNESKIMSFLRLVNLSELT